VVFREPSLQLMAENATAGRIAVSFFSKSFHRGAAAAVEGLTRLMKTRWCFYV
jgi:hypothetical protein